MAERIKRLCPEFDLHFYDAVAPIVTLESVDMTSAYRASRYGKGTADYINCPMTREEYISFVAELRGAKEAPVHGFDGLSLIHISRNPRAVRDDAVALCGRACEQLQPECVQ